MFTHLFCPFFPFVKVAPEPVSVPEAGPPAGEGISSDSDDVSI